MHSPFFCSPRTIRILLFASLLCLFLAFSQAAETISASTHKHTGIVAHSFPCVALGREVEYSVSVPAGEPPEGGWPLVLLLHGDGRNHRTLAEDPQTAALIGEQAFVIVFANGDRGWYLDSVAQPASRYQSMLHELLKHARRTLPVGAGRESTGICGWSMGGYGAMRFAQSFPNEVNAVATTIALLDFPNSLLPPKDNYPVSALFGSDSNLWPTMNCLTHVNALRGINICIVSAHEAFDRAMNHHFHAALEAAAISHTFRDVKGDHDFPTVRATLPLLFEFLSEHLLVGPSRRHRLTEPEARAIPNINPSPTDP